MTWGPKSCFSPGEIVMGLAIAWPGIAGHTWDPLCTTAGQGPRSPSLGTAAASAARSDTTVAMRRACVPGEGRVGLRGAVR